VLDLLLPMGLIAVDAKVGVEQSTCHHCC
jgi:hypothetical protein